MTLDREAIDEALFELLQTKLEEQFEVIGRKHVMPPTLTTAQQPALFCVSLGEQKIAGPRGLPGKLVLSWSLFVYVYDTAGEQPIGEETDLLITKLNDLKTQIEDALNAGPGQAQTLGGLVSHCWIEGETFQDPGIFDKQGWAVIPVKALTAA